MALRTPVRSALAIAIGFACLSLATWGDASAQPIPCATAGTTQQRAAIAAAEAWFGTYWRRTGASWAATYTLQPPAPLPLGIGRFGATREEFGASAGTKPEVIAGKMAVSSCTCALYEAGPDPTYVVRFIGQRLKFNENNAGWTRAIPSGTLHVLAVTVDTAGRALPVRDLPESRTGLPPDLHMLAVQATPNETGPAATRQ